MSQIKVKQIKDTQTNVKINDGAHRIEEIKASLTSCNRKSCSKIEVYNMWENLPSENQQISN